MWNGGEKTEVKEIPIFYLTFYQDNNQGKVCQDHRMSENASFLKIYLVTFSYASDKMIKQIRLKFFLFLFPVFPV